MAIDWDTYRKVRQLFLVEGQSIRAISRQLHMSPPARGRGLKPFLTRYA